MARKTVRVRPEPDREPRAQYAALPWRRTADGDVEVLLITSRETRRWVIPKGWPMKTRTPDEAAAQEAFEEAGVRGDVKKKAIGVFHYDKRLSSGRVQHVRVRVFALQVTREEDTWPEIGQRDRMWCPLGDAAGLVLEPELQTLIAAFAP